MAEATPAANAAPAAIPATVGVPKNRTKDVVKASAAKRFQDLGEYGFYTGPLNADGKRHGLGTMTYDSGNTYEGGFVNDKYHGDKGCYTWFDGDVHTGPFVEGERHGISVFQSEYGMVEYSVYEKGKEVGEGVTWSPDRKTAHRMLDGKKKELITAEEAAKIAEKFLLPVPEPSKVTKTPPPPVPASTTKSIGFIGRLFSSSKVGEDGTLFFKDYGEWGTYEGDVDLAGARQGLGKMTYDSGNSYEGGFVNDKFEGPQGVYKWADGDEYSGEWKDGERNGIGVFHLSDGSVEYSPYEKGSHKGDGIWWSPDRKEAKKLVNGVKKDDLSPGMAEAMAKEKFDLPVPEPSDVKPVAKKPGLIGRLFAKKKVGPDGKMMFKDNGEWGTYDGDLDDDSNRQGTGKMTYVSGNTYEGGFENDKYNGDKGVYTWSDGDVYDGAWKDGERSGVGIFRSTDGSVDYSNYDKGAHVGDGVWWNADRTTAHKMVAGEKKAEMLPEEAAAFAKEQFDLPVPEPSESLPAAVVSAATKSVGLLGRFFATRKVGPGGKPMYKDNGEWGTYEGDVDDSGNRQGKGKMTYASGNVYEGDFVNDKYHGDKGTYTWLDGDSYKGSWKDGERSGTGIFRSPDGRVDYSTYENGAHIGDGVLWSADRQSAFKMVAGKKSSEISLGMAEKLAKDKFNLPVPEPSAAPTTAAPVTSKKGPGLIGRLFSNRKVGPDGKMMYKDHGDWGTYEGDVDADGNRNGTGKMTYNSGNVYEGGFVDDKFHGDKGKYTWTDGESYDGAWKEGERNGIGVFCQADGSVDYSKFENGTHVGDGVWWSADRKEARKLEKGVKKMEMLIEEATAFSKEQFDLPVPEVTAVPAPAAPPASSRLGFFKGLFRSSDEGVVGPDGKLQFKDHGDWGTYEGELDATGKRREGQGEMKYSSGGWYKGPFKDNKYHGDKGTYHWDDGDEYEGSWNEGERNGNGIFRSRDGSVNYSEYKNGSHAGDGISWSADRKTAHKTKDGKNVSELSPGMAEKLAKDKFDLPVPPPYQPPPAASKPSKLGRVFKGSAAKEEPAAKVGPRFEDFGDVGTYYEGELVGGLRQGEGKMSYDSGNSYEGDFSKGNFDGNRGRYRWKDGTEYEGSWKEGAFDGIGIYRTPGVGVDYSMYKDGYATGVGIFWDSDCEKAYYTFDGVKSTEEVSLSDAEQFASTKFGLPVPSTRAPRSLSPSSVGLIGSLFASKKMGKDGKLWCYDNGEWGIYVGTFDANDNRQKGKMTYNSGNTYEGDFVNDKYHGDKGTYTWADGDVYDGAWKDGERNGVGIFRSNDGSVDYSMYDKGGHVGEGVWWSADRKQAHKMISGDKKEEMLPEEAAAFAKEQFDLPVPEPSEVKPAAAKKSIGFIGRIFSKRKVGDDGTLMCKDYGDWGTYEGETDNVGRRQGQGKMTYDSGNTYEGGFLDDKFHGDKGIYTWSDGDCYEGSWKNGERNGKGCFKYADGSVDYSHYENGNAKGEGVKLSADRKSAHGLMDGQQKMEMLIGEAEAMVKDKFGFSV